MANSDVNLDFVDLCVEQIGSTEDKVLGILQAVQGEYGYLPEDALKRICEITDITPAGITGISTFYDFFRHKPAGQHIVRVCIGTACHVKGADAVHEAFQRYLKIEAGDDTDADGLFTI